MLFIKKIIIWINQPSKSKILSLKNKLYHLVFKIIFLIHKILKKINFYDIKFLKSIKYDLFDKDDLTITRCKNEIFIVKGHDTVIGKSAFVKDEPHNFSSLLQCFKIIDSYFKPKLLIDIGANIGTVCIPAVNRNLFDNAIAIEPEPSNFKLLKSNVVINGLENRFKLYKTALSNKKNQIVSLELSNENFGDHLVKISKQSGLYKEQNRKVITTQSNKFDDLIKLSNPNSTLIWIYTQGHEGHVLEGAKKSLFIQTPPIVLLFCPYTLKRAKGLNKLLNFLKKSNYIYFVRLEQNNGKKIKINSKNLAELVSDLGFKGNFSDLLIIK